MLLPGLSYIYRIEIPDYLHTESARWLRSSNGIVYEGLVLRIHKIAGSTLSARRAFLKLPYFPSDGQYTVEQRPLFALEPNGSGGMNINHEISDPTFSPTPGWCCNTDSSGAPTARRTHSLLRHARTRHTGRDDRTDDLYIIRHTLLYIRELDCGLKPQSRTTTTDCTVDGDTPDPHLVACPNARHDLALWSGGGSWSLTLIGAVFNHFLLAARSNRLPYMHLDAAKPRTTEDRLRWG
ncbi:uncharacterized protein BT62DRAFT_1009840 [Guyanagaster necrorhizus]|uniref:Uncharacterized protein n=1 Tax=Guyanagaster necrorhizus TaxID=856835 RepID=A0A9P7VLQ5_9AGAR|nr:uncharacterized protein BT62DRAFT_1009840 [Guyanagaster necrorhizus MCA 3950]KAG7442840.1 hypothetical protein BT62DRAFT_1009840 [Guyanagaster necrorhizus MCA 3950]